MKKAYITLSILLSFLIASSQSIKHQPTPTAKYVFTISDKLHSNLGLEPLDEFAVNFNENNKLSLDGMDKNKKKWKEMMESTYSIIKNDVAAKTKGLTILPYNTLEGKVKYSKFGFPNSELKKAAASCDYTQLLKLKVVFGTRGFDRKIGRGDEDHVAMNTSTKPVLNIFMDFSDAKGKKVASFKGTSLREDSERLVKREGTDVYGPITIKSEGDIIMIDYNHYLDLALEDLIDKLSAE